MALDLTKIVELQDNGTSDMGSLTFGQTIAASVDDNAKARFTVQDQRFALSSLRVHFVGGSGTANLVINVDHGLGPAYDFALLTIENVGTGTDVHRRVYEDDLRHWIFDGRRNDVLVLTWTNPHADMKWGVEIFLEAIEDTGL